MAPARGSGRGRGRGRGRGAAARTPSAPSATAGTTQEDEPEIDVDDSAGRPAAIASSSQPSSSFAPAEASAGAGVPTTARGGSKFKPKAIRRGDKEREELAEAELRKQNEKAAEEARARRENFRGRGRGRGRGSAARARGGAGRRVLTPAGPFSQLPPSIGSQPKASGGFGIGFAGSSSGGGAGSSGVGASGAASHHESYVSASGSFGHERRLNVDFLNVGHAHNLDGHLAERMRNLPVAVPRRERRSSGAVVGDADESDRDKTTGANSPMWVNNGRAVSTVDDNAVWATAPKNPRVKIEGEEVTKIDDLAERREAQRAGDPSASAPAPVAAEPMKNDPASGADAPHPRQETPPQGRLTYGERRNRETLDVLVHGTNEERQEGVCVFYIPKPLPPLDIVPDDDGGDDDNVKAEPADDDDDVAILGGARDGPTVDLTNEELGEIEEDPGTSSLPNGRRPAPPLNIGRGGFLGKMVVRKSGKAEMDWGGFPYKVIMYISRHHLLEAIAIEESETKKKGDDVAYDGTAMALGEVTREFKFAPVLYTDKTPKPFGSG